MDHFVIFINKVLITPIYKELIISDWDSLCQFYITPLHIVFFVIKIVLDRL